MRSFVISFLLLTIMQISTTAQSVEKLYALLNAGNYPDFKLGVDKAREKNANDPALFFGLARYYFEADNTSRTLDSAKKYVRLASQHIASVQKNSTLKRYNALGVREHYIDDLNSRIDAQAFRFADSMNTVSAWNHFLAVNYDASQYNDAKIKRNRIAFLEVRDKYDLTSFERFLKDYPDAAEAGQARELYDRLLYLKQTRDSSWQAYKQFIERYPENPHREEARSNYERLLYADKTKDGTVRSYAMFVSNYPQSPYRTQAEDSIYFKSIRPSTVSNFEAFVKNYSTNPHVNEAWKGLYTLYSADGTNASILKFLNRYPNFPFRDEALRDTTYNNRPLVQFENDEGFYGYKDSTTNDVILDAVFWDLDEFQEGFVFGTRENCDEQLCLYGYYDKAGRERIPPRFNEANAFHQGVAIVAIGDCGADSCLYGVINKLGFYVAPPVYGAILPFSNGLALARKDSLYGFIDREGVAKVSFRYPDANSFSEGLASVYDNSWKMIDTTGKVVVTGNYSKLGSLSEGLCAAADTTGNWGYIDRTGKWIIKPQYLAAEPFIDGKAKVFVNTAKKPQSVKLPKEKYINMQGKVVTSP